MKRRGRLARWPTPPGWMAKDGCTILGCGLPGIARGMCWNHYQRARRGLPVHVYLGKSSTGNQWVERRFGPETPSFRWRREARIRMDLATLHTPCPLTGCWLWLGEYHPNGYGRVGHHRDPWGGWAHRAVIHFRGEKLQAGHSLHVRHICNNPACVNPGHLVYGTAKENMADRSMRYARGELVARARASLHNQDSAQAA